ncbi:MAG TPA: site-specific integrase [Kribbella sp.]
MDRPSVGRYLDSAVVSGAEVVRLLDSLPLADGAPVFLDSETMMPLEPMCSFGRYLSARDIAASTMKDYGRILARFAAFQSQRGKDLLAATETDLQAYKRTRTQLQRKPIGASAWGKESHLLDQFYAYLVKHGHRRQQPARSGPRGRNAMSPQVRQDMSIRHLTLPQYRTSVTWAWVDSCRTHRRRSGINVALRRVQSRWAVLVMMTFAETSASPRFAVEECRSWCKAQAVAAVAEQDSGSAASPPRSLLSRPGCRPRGSFGAAGFIAVADGRSGLAQLQAPCWFIMIPFRSGTKPHIWWSTLPHPHPARTRSGDAAANSCRHHQPPRGRELREPGIGDAVGTDGGHDPVIGCAGRIPERAVTEHDLHVADSGGGHPLAGPLDKCPRRHRPP